MADEPPKPPFDYLIEKGGGKTTAGTAGKWEQTLAAGDYETAQQIYDQACRDATRS
jgi:hypothetical protein